VAFFNEKVAISRKQWEIGPRLLLITNRKSHMLFHMRWKSSNLDVFEGQYCNRSCKGRNAFFLTTAGLSCDEWYDADGVICLLLQQQEERHYSENSACSQSPSLYWWVTFFLSQTLDFLLWVAEVFNCLKLAAVPWSPGIWRQKFFHLIQFSYNR